MVSLSYRMALPWVTAATLLSTLGACAPQPGQGPEPSTSAGERMPSPYPLVADAAGVAKDVVIVRCDLKAGEVVASGTVVNTAEKAADFAISIIWLPGNSADPIGVASTTVPAVESAATVEWSVAAILLNDADRCAVNARRGSLG